ncbi:MAG: dihydrofolate reductase [Taibaiella sp.]|nr:dihydrofolate reductase [Taibaiella sp.]
MRKVILGLAVSLDGFIEGPNGEYDWCYTDQDYGMTDFLNSVDTILFGRKSYEVAIAAGDNYGMPDLPKMKEYVFSTTLRSVKPGAVLVKEDTVGAVKQIKADPGKDIWLFGGAALTSSLIKDGLVDELWLSVHPILLGKGRPLFDGLQRRYELELLDTKVYDTGLVSMRYRFKNER